MYNGTATPALNTLPLPDALPISTAGEDLVAVRLVAHVPDQPVDRRVEDVVQRDGELDRAQVRGQVPAGRDRKSTRLNSSHGYISYAVFCLKKKTLIPVICTQKSL